MKELSFDFEIKSYMGFSREIFKNNLAFLLIDLLTDIPSSIFSNILTLNNPMNTI